jgi:hypothetical protein
MLPTRCQCPRVDGTPTADDLEQIAACPETTDDERDLFARAALRLRLRAAMRDPRSILFDLDFSTEDR